MKSIVAPFIALLLTHPAVALSPGDQVKPDAIAKADFLKGEPLKTWEAGKSYLIACWATGSNASVLTLPMLQDLHDLYSDKGLRVIAINTGENDKAKVSSFLESQGKRITHSVAFVPSGDTFQTEWVESAKVTKLPYAFLVKDGRYIFGGHPAKLNGEMINAVLAGGEQLEDLLDGIERAKIAENVLNGHLRDYSAAQLANDPDGMEKAMALIADTDPTFIHLSRMKVDVDLIRKDWSAATSNLKAIKNPQASLMAAALISRRYDTLEEQPTNELLEAVAEILAANMAEDPSIKASLARVQWKLGKKDEAITTARLAALKPDPLDKGTLENFAKSFEDGDPQSLDDLIRALNAAGK